MSQSDFFKNRVLPETQLREPIERAETLPSDWYTEPEMVLIEKKAIFSREWQLVGHLSQIPESGNSLMVTIADNPLILVRDADTVRAFYNVCRHRGGPLAVKRGTRTMLQCQYHGWTYKIDGSLRGVPQFNCVELFDKKDFGLTPVPVQIWEGLLFVSIAENPRPFEEVVQGISERIAPIRLGELRYHTRTEDIINCNWKVYADNYLEGYHIPIVHPELAKLLDYSQYATETSKWYSLQHSPFSADSNDNPYQTENGEAFYYFIYPNIMLNILPGRLQTNVIEPLGHDRCKVIFDFYYADVDRAVGSGLAADDLSYSAKIQAEDIEICEAVQRGLNSKAYHKGRFSVERELGVYHFQSVLRREIGE